MRIGFDMDGVIYDFDTVMRRYLCNKGAITLKQGATPATSWHFYRDMGLTDQQFLDWMERGTNEDVIFTDGTPYTSAARAIRGLRDEGHSIHIVTHRIIGRPGAVWDATGRWLDRWDIPYDGVYFTADKGAANVDFYVDDKPENVRAALDEGITSWLIDRPWNQYAVDLNRVIDLEDYARQIRRSLHG